MPQLTKEERRVLAIEKARQRRASRAIKKEQQIEWFIDEVSDKIEQTMRQRVRTATEFLRSRVVQNISVPVKKEIITSYTKTGKQTSRVVVTERSKPGEYPRADTTQLMKTIFGIVENTSEGIVDGYVGTPLDYGLVLETSKKLNRRFLRRTLHEERTRIFRILTGPIKGATGTPTTGFS